MVKFRQCGGVAVLAMDKSCSSEGYSLRCMRIFQKSGTLSSNDFFAMRFHLLRIEFASQTGCLDHATSGGILKETWVQNPVC